MSRTFRCKNYEQERPSTSWTSRKVAGYYTQSDWVHDSLYTYRAPTKQEWWHDYKRNHADKRQGRRGPGKYWRKHEHRMERTNYKAQFTRWLSNAEFEIIYQGQPTSARWAWS